jgi:oligopeptide/dipeptide ABC transporter ATP-binding protein
MELLAAADLAARARHPYTRALLASIPSTDPHVQRGRLHSPPPGEPPSPLSPPSGCVYRTRCPYALPLCAERVPAWESLTSEHQLACHRQRELA